MRTFIDLLHEKFVARNIEESNDEPDVEAWRRFLANLPTPKSNIEKSYNKYLCRMFYFPLWKKLIMNTFGLCSEIIILVIALFSRKTINPVKRDGVLVLERSRAVPDYTDVVPNELFTKYKDVITVDNYNKKFGMLCKETRKEWFAVVKRYPFSFFFHYWVFMELAAHSFFLLRYNPEATAVYVNERNVASPIITGLYESDGRKFISFMHGEYLLQLIQAHMKFSEYYIWDASYIEMFRDILRCEANFIPYKPLKMQKRWHIETSNPRYYCTYYFGSETKKTIYSIAKIFSDFEKDGKKCKIRLHPRDIVHTELIKQVFSEAGIEIEDNKEITLEKSLADTQYAVGMQTTVLFEALTEGRAIAIDDISDPDYYKNLQERCYRLTKCEHVLLSDLVHERA